MLDRALAAGVPFRYFTADSGYGRDPALRARCHTCAVAYVMAVPVDLPLVEPAGGATRPDRVLAAVPKAVWVRRSCGAGTKGERYYDWAVVTVTVKDVDAAARRSRVDGNSACGSAASRFTSQTRFQPRDTAICC